MSVLGGACEVVVDAVRRPPIERASQNDLMELASDVGSAPMQVAAILLLETPVDLSSVRGALADRIRPIPRLRQRLVRPPLGCGRPVWVDDPRFDIADHVRSRRCPRPGDEPALLGVAAGIAVDRLPADRPLWAVTLVTELAGGRSALILVVHHVLADGIGGLAVLARLVDGVPVRAPADRTFPAPAPARRDLFVDAATSRLRALAALPSGARLVRDAVAELRPTGTARPPRCSLNRPTGPRRSLAVARADLAALQAVAHAHGATVNDVLLTAVAGALHAVLRHRGETAESFLISVPVSRRREASVTQLGNQVGVIPVDVPAVGDTLQRLDSVSRETRARRRSRGRGASATLLGPAFRLLARVGALRWFIDHQRLVTTFVTNLRGPSAPLTFLGAAIDEITPVSLAPGNVTVAFAALSYAGTLAVTVIADPDNCPDLPLLAAEVQAQLDELAKPDSTGASWRKRELDGFSRTMTTRPGDGPMER